MCVSLVLLHKFWKKMLCFLDQPGLLFVIPAQPICTPKIPTIVINFLLLSIAQCPYIVQHSFNTQSGMTAAMAVSPALQISPAFQVAHNRDKLISPQVRMPHAKNVPSLREVFKKWKFLMAFVMKGGGGLMCH